MAGVDPRVVPHESQAKIHAANVDRINWVNDLARPPTFASAPPVARFAASARHVRCRFCKRRTTVKHDTTSLWLATRQAPSFNPLDRDLDVDIAIVGGGISGLTAAVLLSRAGARIAVFERD